MVELSGLTEHLVHCLVLPGKLVGSLYVEQRSTLSALIFKYLDDRIICPFVKCKPKHLSNFWSILLADVNISFQMPPRQLQKFS